MHIGEVAKRTGVSIDTIRFYERNGILPKPLRTENGYRLYSSAELETMHFVHRMKALGFSLQQIRELASLRVSRRQPCAPVRNRLLRKLAEVRAKVDELERLEHELRAELRKCERQLRAHARRCPLLESATIKPGQRRK